MTQAWTPYALGSLFDFSNGVNASKSAYGAGTPFANVLEVISSESLTESDVPGKVRLSQSELRRYAVQHGDVLFNRTSETPDEVGLASTYVGASTIVFGGFVLRGRPKTRLIDVQYSKYALRAPDVRKQIVARGQGGIRANVGQRDLSSVIVHLPPLPRQQEIAAMLDDASRLVHELVALIAKKRAMKRGAVQALITGRSRVPGFDDAWQSPTIGNLARVVGGGTPATGVAEFWGGNIPWFTPAEIAKDGSGLVSASRRWITEAGLKSSSAQLLPAYSVLVTSRASIGNVAVTTVTATTNQGFASLVPRDPRSTWFLYYSVQHHRKSIEAIAAGSTFLEISAPRLAAMRIPAPSLSEQEAIARILLDMDAEIETLEARLRSAHSVKQGMIQQILVRRGLDA